MTDPVIHWRCFYCDEAFTLAQEKQAAWHFGDRMHTTPLCKLNGEDVRNMERELERYREEDSDMHRLLHSRQSEHQTALRREEEKGYARGLRDAKQWPNPI